MFDGPGGLSPGCIGLAPRVTARRQTENRQAGREAVVLARGIPPLIHTGPSVTSNGSSRRLIASRPAQASISAYRSLVRLRASLDGLSDTVLMQRDLIFALFHHT